MTDTVPTDWETKTLGEVCSLIMGQSPESESVNGDGVGYPFFQGNADFGRKYPDVRQWCIDPKKLSPSGGILVSVRAPVGEINTANQECCIGRGLGAIIPEKIVANFIYQYMFLARKDLVAVSQGSTFQAINKDDLKDLSIPCPPLGEQEKIADILTSVDDTIEHTQAQVAKLQDLKTATMNELLTRGIGHTEFRESELGLIPTTWEIVKISDVCDIQTGGKDTQDADLNGKYPFFVRSQIEKRINSYSYDGEAILTAGDGVGTGKVFHYINGKFDFHQRVYKLSEFKKNVIGKFVYFYFKKNFLKQVERYSAKGSVDSVRLEMIAGMALVLPPLVEQEKIADVLTSLDDQIESIELKLVQLESLKKSLMGDLLTGRVRVSVN